MAVSQTMLSKWLLLGNESSVILGRITSLMAFRRDKFVFPGGVILFLSFVIVYEITDTDVIDEMSKNEV